MKFLWLICLSLTIAWWGGHAHGEDAAAASDPSELLFVRRIGPLLREKCVACHGGDPQEIEGSLDLRSYAGLARGGDSEEPSVVPGKPDASPLFLAARRDHDLWSSMPPKEAERLTAEQLKWLRDWIVTGAKWPSQSQQDAIALKHAEKWSVEDGIPVKTSGGLAADWTNRKYKPAGLWANRPLQKVDVSAATQNGQNPIDYLIANALPEGLQPAPSATRRELIRRATFDLTGLPPAPGEVEAFLGDKRSDDSAFAAVIDRLLNSPHYGERMAQHWLDVVRYADSSGFANDYQRGNAWRYRDYVIRSFNADKPYDQFVREQIAGDELQPDDPEGRIAVGYLRMGPWELTGMEVARVARQRFLDDVTNSVGETFLGHSLQCARCHDHKFDPVPTRDYYSIQAVFATTQLAERSAPFLQAENVEGFDEQRYLHVRKKQHTDDLQQLRAAMVDNSKVWFEEQLQAASEDQKQKIRERKKEWDQALAKAIANKQADPFSSVRSQFMRRGVPQDEFPPKLVGFTPNQHGLFRVARKGIERLGWELDRYRPYALSVYNGHTPQFKSVKSPLRVPQDRMQGQVEDSCIRSGGDPFAKGEAVEPGILSVIADQVSAEIPVEVAGRRTAFARWVAAADNPLTTRVIVNRIWQWHFGQAIAGNPNNFGSTGALPTHPQLLDYLAKTFVQEGWSVKRLHRQIMMSQAYRRSTTHPQPEELAKFDPLGKSYAVFQPRRLTAEEIRDAMLAVTGELNPKLGGIPCRPEINIEVALQPRMVMGTFAAAWVPNPKPQQRHRRSIYALKLRGMLHPMLEVFNSPAPDFSCERREASTVTPQVFSLFNGQNSYSRALALANRARQEVAELPVDQRDDAAIARCFELALGRSPSRVETKDFLAHWKKLEATLPNVARPSPQVPLKVTREAVEENTGERFTFEERLFANEEFVTDLQPVDVDRHVRALGDLCLILLNSNEFVYVY